MVAVLVEGRKKRRGEKGKSSSSPRPPCCCRSDWRYFDTKKEPHVSQSVFGRGKKERKEEENKYDTFCAPSVVFRYLLPQHGELLVLLIMPLLLTAPTFRCYH